MAQQPTDLDNLWVSIPRAAIDEKHEQESMPDRVQRVTADLDNINDFYNVSISETRLARLKEFCSTELRSLSDVDFDALSQQHKVDYLLLRNFLRRKSHQVDDDRKAARLMAPLLPFIPLVMKLRDIRDTVKEVHHRDMAADMDAIRTMAESALQDVQSGKLKANQTIAYKASKALKELQGHLAEFFRFYSSYDPLFDWWVSTPWRAADQVLTDYLPVIQEKLLGMHGDGKDDIIGEPIGREALLVELDAEMIAYSPEELIGIANNEFKWCEVQMKKASKELGYGDDWQKAMAYVKTQSSPPGEYTRVVKDLAREGASYVRKHDLVTVPRLADETYRMYMMGAEQQKVSPFFLGGSAILVAYPTADMPFDLKEMVMRGNNRHFARATAFHELVPGHRLHFHYMQRCQTHRALFETGFAVEGWGLYWEMNFWNRGDFFVTPEDRIGTLFWRMHRCARIILSLRFHLGEMTPQQCIDMLVNKVGHERSTAEGEVRRWFNGDYGPLYQVAYMIGALQLTRLKKEALETGRYTEKQFNDKFLQLNAISIEMVRALTLGTTLTADFKPNWRFYG